MYHVIVIIVPFPLTTFWFSSWPGYINSNDAWFEKFITFYVDHKLLFLIEKRFLLDECILFYRMKIQDR